jgi:acetaldehyde dehydrogenase
VTQKVRVAVVGPGNIGTDLMMKLRRSHRLELAALAGIEESEGIRRARALGVPTFIGDLRPILDDASIRIVFDATSARAHLRTAPLLEKAGKIAIDLTPAAVGPYVVPTVNLAALREARNLNMVTCGGQATVPIIHAIHRDACAF